MVQTHQIGQARAKHEASTIPCALDSVSVLFSCLAWSICSCVKPSLWHSRPCKRWCRGTSCGSRVHCWQQVSWALASCTAFKMQTASLGPPLDVSTFIYKSLRGMCRGPVVERMPVEFSSIRPRPAGPGVAKATYFFAKSLVRISARVTFCFAFVATAFC